MATDDRPEHPDTASVGRGYDPVRHLGSLKPPIYETSTFVFATAEEGKRFFEVTYGLDEARDDEELGYIYSRLDSPNLMPAEERLAFWEEAEEALLFNSGMAAVTTVFLTFLRPGDTLLYGSPIYGGTATLCNGLLPELGIDTVPFRSDASLDDIESLLDGASPAMIYIETPANPTNDIFDIEIAAVLADRHEARLVVDNTFLSPVWQKPLVHGADISLHSATKYLGGHSDLTAGAVSGGRDDIGALRHMRYKIGTTASPSTAWLVARSLETLRLRVEQQTANATRVAEFLAGQEKVSAVNHLSRLEPGDPRHDIYQRQCLGPGAMISFEVRGGEAGAFRFLNAMQLVHLTVSLGGTESLASHPWSMSHIRVPEDEKLAIGVTPGLIRFSVGIEHADDLIVDLDRALAAI
ncbi:MAG: aminotransferase class I/II-fold pyridoxal phosphate-dependent enzyme [Acidimicrobiia bacterium]|jgi:methionine-gamma-lyase